MQRKKRSSLTHFVCIYCGSDLTCVLLATQRREGGATPNADRFDQTWFLNQGQDDSRVSVSITHIEEACH